MEKNFLWAKTLLSSYRYLERVAGAIDKIILKTGLSCQAFSLYSNNDAYLDLQKIIDLSERKITLINVKILIEDALSEIDEGAAQILIEKFFDKVKTRELCELHDISMRTVFRKIDGALNAFTCRLNSKGFVDEQLKALLKNESWINSAYQRISEGGVDELSMDTLLPKHLK